MPILHSIRRLRPFSIPAFALCVFPGTRRLPRLWLVHSGRGWPWLLRQCAGWGQCSLRRWLQAQHWPAQGSAPQRLAQQVLLFSDARLARLQRMPLPVLMRLARPLAFVHTPPAAQNRAAWRGWHLAPDPGTWPLARWLLLERHLLARLEALQHLSQARLFSWPLVLAMALQRRHMGFVEAHLPRNARRLARMPLPVALGFTQALLKGISAVQQQYPELFEPAALPAAADPPSTGPWEAYQQRWGWTALLADLNGGRLSPTDRQRWLEAPLHLVLQELARLHHLRQVQRSQHQALARHWAATTSTPFA